MLCIIFIFFEKKKIDKERIWRRAILLSLFPFEKNRQKREYGREQFYYLHFFLISVYNKISIAIYLYRITIIMSRQLKIISYNNDIPLNNILYMLDYNTKLILLEWRL